MKNKFASRLAIIGAAAFLLAGCGQEASRKWGGDISFVAPQDVQLVSMTWKESSLWVLYYLPAEKACVFKESSHWGVLEGSVTVLNCNPLSFNQGVRNAED